MPYIIPGVGNVNFDSQGNQDGPGAISNNCFAPVLSCASQSVLNTPPADFSNAIDPNTPLLGRGSGKGTTCGQILTADAAAKSLVFVPRTIPKGYHVVQSGTSCFLKAN